MDAAPRPTSQLSWNPAVPPPPVAGAAAGNAVADGRRPGDRRPLGLGAGDGLRVADELRVADGLGVADALALGFVAAVVWLGETVRDPETPGPGDNAGRVAAGVDPAQPATDAETTTVIVAKPAAASLAPSPVPAGAVRVFIGPPHASGGWRTVSGPASQPVSEGSRDSARSLPAPADGSHQGRADGDKGKPAAITANPFCCPDLQWLVHH
jgi:hypothetical protein